ncbi:hypothetical protein EG68_08900 [Paragonimus skrjabini miyazakii]|uniref:Uncharacterized protein n=1 Tax=Paragonimus skrjabini miyazakii TaxID=59628 RepID=A0A8S9YPH5_9TREM|nr:hypothetical protein EG68_08900 [Paragonimus skrjabini miyazakii]
MHSSNNVFLFCALMIFGFIRALFCISPKDYVIISNPVVNRGFTFWFAISHSCSNIHMTIINI